MAEDPLVAVAHRLLERFLVPPLKVLRGAPLLYSVTVNNALRVTVDPKNPVRGQAAFETDLCVFESTGDVELPRVVLEFKTGITTHDVLTYIAKARKHKQIYPYLRYGIVMAGERTIPGRFFLHNESLDFAVAALAMEIEELPRTLQSLIEREIAVSRQLEEIAFSKPNAVAFSSAISLERLS